MARLLCDPKSLSFSPLLISHSSLFSDLSAHRVLCLGGQVLCDGCDSGPVCGFMVAIVVVVAIALFAVIVTVVVVVQFWRRSLIW